MVPEMLLKFSPTATQEDWQRVLIIVRALPGVVSAEVPPARIVDQVGGSVGSAQRGKAADYWVANTLGVCVAEIGRSDLEAVMMSVLLECQGAFTSVDVLFAILHQQSPTVWTAAHRAQVVPVYSKLRKKVGHTDYRLLPSGRGAYGLESRRDRALAHAEQVRLVKNPQVVVVDKHAATG